MGKQLDGEIACPDCEGNTRYNLPAVTLNAEILKLSCNMDVVSIDGVR
jgi:hypothetical protein